MTIAGKKLAHLPIPESESASSFESNHTDDGKSSQIYVVKHEVLCEHEPLAFVNRCLDAIGESPIVQKKLKQVKYPREKLKKIRRAMKKKVLPKLDSDNSDEEN